MSTNAAPSRFPPYATLRDRLVWVALRAFCIAALVFLMAPVLVIVGITPLLVMGACFEFIGAFWCSGQVAGKLASNIIPSLTSQTELVQDQMMLSVGIASFLFILSSSFFGVPISGTHTVVGALIGAGLAGLGSQDISWSQLRRIVLSWFVSPVLSSFLCFCLMIMVAMLTLNGVGMSLKPRLFNLTIISGLVFSLITFMVIILIQDNVIYPWQYWLLPSAFVIGFLACRAFLAYVCLAGASLCSKVAFTLSFWSLEPCI